MAAYAGQRQMISRRKGVHNVLIRQVCRRCGDREGRAVICTRMIVSSDRLPYGESFPGYGTKNSFELVFEAGFFA